MQRYLIQHQDAVEALWFRLHNLANQGGRAVMTDRYFEVTTMYALVRVLAIERIMALDGVHPQLDAIDSGLAEYLRQQPISRQLEGLGFHQYDRLSLAESVIEREEGQFRGSTYLEFRRRYEPEGSAERQNGLRLRVKQSQTWMSLE